MGREQRELRAQRAEALSPSEEEAKEQAANIEAASRAHARWLLRVQHERPLEQEFVLRERQRREARQQQVAAFLDQQAQGLVRNPEVVDLEAPECAICWQALLPGETVTVPCQHTYCKDCIKEWLMWNPSCPMCRRNFQL